MRKWRLLRRLYYCGVVGSGVGGPVGLIRFGTEEQLGELPVSLPGGVAPCKSNVDVIVGAPVQSV